ncbi:hypothetical protein ACIBEJ_34375 [Nonomuraea sp. NPDC050790]|uniref:hypothetical protein n=1 Tax=Nonomuraea sp. NPDC050790 TaxID=3364371 RepID=UPI00379846DA
MPWRGPEVRGEFPTLGYALGEWIEANCVVPDGPLMGEPYLLTEEMWNHLLWSYRLRPDARDVDGSDALVYSGSMLVRPQKWGKDPFNACRCAAHALGPVVFAGWDARGEPVGRPHPSPWVAVAATAEDQTDNTFRPLVTMLRDGPLASTPGLDVGETRIKLPGIGWIDPVTASARARLGGRFTFVSITESGLLVGTGPTGGVTFGRVLKRNVAGMNGQWSEITNPWDPTEKSVAQLTYEAKAPDVYIDYRAPRRKVDLEDEEQVLREIIYLYGDSSRHRGGWVSERRILRDIQNPATGEAEARRFFLQEITAGASDAVNSARWDALASSDDPLRPGERVTLGFDGSRSRDATALRVCRIRDGRLFHLQIWEPDDDPKWRVPRGEVDQAVKDAFAAYEVWYLYADPYRWQDYLDAWAALFPNRVVEFPTNVDTRMDKAIERFLTAVKAGELSHDGNEVSTRHAKNAALAKGKRKPAREDDSGAAAEHYLRVVKKKHGLLIDDFVAGILAYEARGQAIEDGALEEQRAPNLW